MAIFDYFEKRKYQLIESLFFYVITMGLDIKKNNFDHDMQEHKIIKYKKILENSSYFSDEPRNNIIYKMHNIETRENISVTGEFKNGNMDFIYVRAVPIFEYYDLYDNIENYLTVKYKYPKYSVKEKLENIKISANTSPEKIKDIKRDIINKSEYCTEWIIKQNSIKISLEPAMVLSVFYDENVFTIENNYSKIIEILKIKIKNGLAYDDDYNIAPYIKTAIKHNPNWNEHVDNQIKYIMNNNIKYYEKLIKENTI